MEKFLNHILPKEKHPDKHSDKDEDTRKLFEEEFQELLNIYNELAKFVVEKSEEESEEEEILAREEFKKFHIVNKNLSLLIFSLHILKDGAMF